MWMRLSPTRFTRIFSRISDGMRSKGEFSAFSRILRESAIRFIEEDLGVVLTEPLSLSYSSLSQLASCVLHDEVSDLAQRYASSCWAP